MSGLRETLANEVEMVSNWSAPLISQRAKITEEDPTHPGIYTRIVQFKNIPVREVTIITPDKRKLTLLRQPSGLIFRLTYKNPKERTSYEIEPDPGLPPFISATSDRNDPDGINVAREALEILRQAATAK
jgi:hypothetical protein